MPPRSALDSWAKAGNIRKADEAAGAPSFFPSRSLGFRIPLLEGDCDWPRVMKTLDDIGYSGWGAAEVRGGDRERLLDISQRLDRIYAS